MKHLPVVFCLLLAAGLTFAADPPTPFATIQFDSDFKYPADAGGLIYKGRDVEELTLQFVASKPPLFKLQAWRPQDPKRTDLVTEVGKKFGGLRSFTILKHTDIQGFSTKGQPADLSELELRDEGTGKHFVLRKGVATTLPVLFAKFTPRDTATTSSTLRIKEGAPFVLPNHPGDHAEVLAVFSDRVRVRCAEKDFDLLLDVEGCENLRVHGTVQNKDGKWMPGVYADVPKDLLLDRSGKTSPFPVGVPSNLQYKSNGIDIIASKVIAGPKCVPQ